MLSVRLRKHQIKEPALDVGAIDDIVARIETTPVRTTKDAGLWQRHKDDWYVEPSWCSERLFATEYFAGTVVDPSCGSGNIVRAGRAARNVPNPIHQITKVFGYDIVKRCKECDSTTEDFLLTDYETDNIVSNPPFGLCKKPDFAFVRRALDTATKKVALLLPLPWLTGADKGAWLKTTPLAKVLILTPRPSMPPGPVIEAGLNPGGGTEDFAWMVWDHDHKGPPTLGWRNRDG